jgi:hypothetical protein
MRIYFPRGDQDLHRMDFLNARRLTMRLYLRGEIAETKRAAEIICFRHKVILLKCSSARIEKARNKLQFSLVRQPR